MNAIANTAARISELYRHFGTVTDISALTRCSRDAVLYGPIVSADHLKVLLFMIERGANDRTTDGIIDFARDGRKILSFCQAYADMFAAEWQKSIEAGNAAVRWEMVKIIIRWIVEGGENHAKQKCIDFHDREITRDEWREYCGSKLDFIFQTDMDEAEKTELIAAFKDARENFDKHLTRLWSELFAVHGVKGAVEWMRGFWVPLDEATKDRVNAAFLAAKKTVK